MIVFDEAEQGAALVPRKQVTTDEEMHLAAYQPTTLADLIHLAGMIAKSSICPADARGDVGAIAMLVAFGSTRGLKWSQSLMELSVIKGKVTASAQLLHAWCASSPECEQFDVIEATPKQATIRVKRRGWTESRDFTYTLEEAKTAGIMRQGGAWFTNPRAMCVARARSSAARLWFPEVVSGVYAAEEIKDDPTIAAAPPLEATVAPEEPSTPMAKLRAAARRAAAVTAPPPLEDAEIVSEVKE